MKPVGCKEYPLLIALGVYDCPYSGLTHMLVAINAQSVPSIDHNLFVAFILREAGVIVNATAKIRCQNPSATSVEGHSISDEKSGLRTPLSLQIFSVFKTRLSSEKEIEELENYQMICITLDSAVWDCYNEGYRMNEESLVDFRGDISR